ncbi:MAG: hypothetical protein AB7S78_04085 [Candidatus Omnitrophota bacterium]
MQHFPMDNLTGPDWAKLKESLRSGHSLILQQIDQCKTDRKSSAASEQFRVLEQIMLAHMSLQTSDIYKSLFNHLNRERLQVKVLEYLEYDLKVLKIKLLGFIETPAKTFFELSNDLMARVTVEKEYLFPLVDLLLTHSKRKIHVYEN